MSQTTEFTDLNEQFPNELFEQYYDEIFRQFPLPINIHLQEDQEVSDEEIVEMKVKWIIEYFVARVRTKPKIKEMIDPILDLGGSGKSKEKIFKNIGNIKIMLKHCETQEIAPLITETIFQALWKI